MKWWYIAAAALVGLAASSDAQAQPAPATALDNLASTSVVPLVQWPYHTYHPDYPIYCRTCYGGGGCYSREGKGQCAGGGCITLNGGVGSCAIYGPGIQTCRKCGVIGRMLFYECKRLGCNQTGGEGCDVCWALCKHHRSCGECYTGGCGCDAIKHTTNMTFCDKIRAFRNRPLGGRTVLSGPWQYRYYAYGWKEGPMSYYGVCVGAYESFLAGNFDDRGPLNVGPSGVGSSDAFYANLNGAPTTVAPISGPSPYVPNGPAVVEPQEVPGPNAPPFNLDRQFESDPAADESPRPPVEAASARRAKPREYVSSVNEHSFE